MPDAPIPLPIQVRDLPAMRAACMSYQGPASGLGVPFEELQRFVVSAGIGPAGPLMAAYRMSTGEALGDRKGNSELIDALLLVPVTRLTAEPPKDIEMRRFASLRAACLVYSGPMDSNFLQHHQHLFAWMDANALPRAGDDHQHAYLAQDKATGHWTIEIRATILATDAAAAGA